MDIHDQPVGALEDEVLGRDFTVDRNDDLGLVCSGMNAHPGDRPKGAHKGA